MMDPVRASVCTRGVETPYLRAGRGHTVVCLGLGGNGEGGPGGAESGTPRQLREVLDGIGSGIRVIAPLVPPPGEGQAGPDAEEWLRDLLEGLGLERPAILGPPAFAPLLDSFLEADPERIAGVLLLSPSQESASRQGVTISLRAQILSLFPPGESFP